MTSLPYKQSLEDLTKVIREHGIVPYDRISHNKPQVHDIIKEVNILRYLKIKIFGE